MHFHRLRIFGVVIVYGNGIEGPANDMVFDRLVVLRNSDLPPNLGSLLEFLRLCFSLHAFY